LLTALSTYDSVATSRPPNVIDEAARPATARSSRDPWVKSTVVAGSVVTPLNSFHVLADVSFTRPACFAVPSLYPTTRPRSTVFAGLLCAI
jgi:hypothetical protein